MIDDLFSATNLVKFLILLNDFKNIETRRLSRVLQELIDAPNQTLLGKLRFMLDIVVRCIGISGVKRFHLILPLATLDKLHNVLIIIVGIIIKVNAVLFPKLFHHTGC